LIQKFKLEPDKPRRKVKSHVKALKKALSTDNANVSLSKEVEKRRERLGIRIENWRDCQKDLTPQLGDLVAQQAIQKKTVNTPEEEVLYIPSDFTEAECIKYDLVRLGEHERHFLEGTAFDYISKVKTIMKTFFSSHANKKAQGYSQQTHTRSISEIEDIEERQTTSIADYSVIRNAMITLGMSQHDPSFPPLSKEDMYRKPTHLKRAVGDSRRNDGALWSTGISGGVSHVTGSPATSLSSYSPLTDTPPVVTQAIHRKRKNFTYTQMLGQSNSPPAFQGRAPQPEGETSKHKRVRIEGPLATVESTSVSATVIEESDRTKEGMLIRLHQVYWQ
jgi:hypothetical protein